MTEYHITVKQLGPEDEYYWVASIAEVDGLRGYGKMAHTALWHLSKMLEFVESEEASE